MTTNNEVIITDFAEISDILNHRIREKGGQIGSKIKIVNPETNEVQWEGSNKVVISGAVFNAMLPFNLANNNYMNTYNDWLGLDESVDHEAEVENKPIVCLFCVDDSGCGSTPKDVFTVNFTDRIEPDSILPFRYIDDITELDEDLRQMYFGRKTFTDGRNKKAYYFKAFDTDPQLHIRYTDGTQIDPNNLFDVSTSQAAEVFVEMRLRVNRYDFRDYFDQVLGWDNARISSLSLCYAWYKDIYEEDYGEYHRYYQAITPYTKINFPYNWLVDLDKAVDFIYDIYY